jgi:ribosomal protein L7/L12
MSEATIVFGIVAAGIALLLARVGSLERRLDRLSRVEAKLDALMTHSAVTFDPYRDVPAEVREALDRGETIEAIRRLRQATGVDLKSAKEVVDELKRRRHTA